MLPPSFTRARRRYAAVASYTSKGESLVADEGLGQVVVAGWYLEKRAKAIPGFPPRPLGLRTE